MNTVTYFNQSWLEDNVNEIGILENANVMNKSNYNEIDLNDYFTNNDLQSELNTASSKTINRNSDKATAYDYGIRNTMIGVINDYVNGALAEEDVQKRIEADLATFYN